MPAIPPTELEKRLTAHGLFEVEDCGNLAPKQVTGRLPEGNWFYYRDRHSRVRLEIYPPGHCPHQAPFSDPIWEHGMDTEVAAIELSYETVDERAETYILQFSEKWRIGEPGQPDGITLSQPKGLRTLVPISG